MNEVYVGRHVVVKTPNIIKIINLFILNLFLSYFIQNSFNFISILALILHIFFIVYKFIHFLYRNRMN